MPRAGRLLEELVYKLESALADKSVDIRSPDFIVGGITKVRREIDVTLRSTVGSAEILIIIECRDRRAIQDVTWIEQIASKREDVGAHKAIAVSATGFSQGAQNVARAKHIELRSFEDVTEDLVFNWLMPLTAEHRTRRLAITGGQIDLGEVFFGTTPSEALKAARTIRERCGISPDLRFLVRKADNMMISLDDIWCTASGLGLLLDEAFPCLPPGEKQLIAAVINFERPQFCLGLDDGLIDVKSVILEGQYSYLDETLPISRYKYVAPSGTIAENAEVHLRHGQEQVMVGLHAASDGTLSATYRSTGTNPGSADMDLTISIFHSDATQIEEQGD